MKTVYGDVKEVIPSNAPPPKGMAVRTTTYCDANLMHDLVTGRSCSGIEHFVNQTPIAWFSKRQNQVETATYGSEFMAARQAVEQIVDLRYTLRMMGVPLDGASWLFGDNQSVVTQSTIPHSVLSKRWNALSYHRVREAIAAGYIRFEHLDGKDNPADILTKNLPHHVAKAFTEPLLFWKGDTADYHIEKVDEDSDLINESTQPQEEGSDEVFFSEAFVGLANYDVSKGGAGAHI